MIRRSIWSLHLLTVALATGVLLLPAGCGGKKKKTSDTDETDSTEPETGGPSRQQMAQWRATDQNNLKRLGLSIHNYESAYGGVPLAATCDNNGKPLLSWRVTVLPWLEQDGLSNQFKLDEPWDSPHNKALIGSMPGIFLSPGRSKPGDTTTYYRVLATTDPAMQGRPMFIMPSEGKGRPGRGGFSDIKDTLANTLMIVEAEEGVPWTKPEALMYDPKGPLPKLSYFYDGISYAAMADGSVHPIKKIVSEKTLRSAITMNAGDLLGSDW